MERVTSMRTTLNQRSLTWNACPTICAEDAITIRRPRGARRYSRSGSTRSAGRAKLREKHRIRSRRESNLLPAKQLSCLHALGQKSVDIQLSSGADIDSTIADGRRGELQGIPCGVT